MLVERGRPEARTDIDRAIKVMETGNFADAERQFISLCHRFPAGRACQQARIHSLRSRRHARSIELCELVIEMKPHHFGHGMASLSAR